MKKQQIVSESHDLFTNLPMEIMLDIVLRLPLQSIVSCKYVCKSWRDLLVTPEFLKSHLSISVPGLAVYLKGTNQYEIVESEDEHHLKTVFSFDLPFISEPIMLSSVNGLLFVCNRNDYAFICNPITREYIRLPSPLRTSHKPTMFDKEIYGFGVSKVSRQYKVVRINFNVFGCFLDCQVYTVGSGSWRRIELDDQLRSNGDTVGAFLNGNLHWLAYNKDFKDDDLICCLDLETERFSTSSAPDYHGYDYRTLSVLGNYLCVCDAYAACGVVYDIDILLMKEYGDEKSWTKEFLISPRYSGGDHCPIKVFKDGDMLLQWRNCRLLYYASKSETIRQNLDGFSCTYTPSFLPLKTFAMENVISF